MRENVERLGSTTLLEVTPPDGGLLKHWNGLCIVIPACMMASPDAHASWSNRHPHSLPILLLNMRAARHGLVQRDIDQMNRASVLLRPILREVHRVVLVGLGHRV